MKISEKCPKCVKPCKDCKLFKKSGRSVEPARLFYNRDGSILVVAATTHLFQPHQKLTALSFFRSL